MDQTLQDALVIATAIGAVAWVASVLLAAATLARARAAGDADVVVARAASVARTSRFIGLPAALLVAAAGGWYVLGRDLAIESHWWLGTAIGVWIVAFFGSTIVRSRQLRHASALADKHGAGDEDVQWRIRRVDLTARGELMLLAVCAVVVVLQPTTML